MTRREYIEKRIAEIEREVNAIYEREKEEFIAYTPELTESEIKGIILNDMYYETDLPFTKETEHQEERKAFKELGMKYSK